MTAHVRHSNVEGWCSSLRGHLSSSQSAGSPMLPNAASYLVGHPSAYQGMPSSESIQALESGTPSTVRSRMLFCPLILSTFTEVTSPGRAAALGTCRCARTSPGSISVEFQVKCTHSSRELSLSQFRGKAGKECRSSSLVTTKTTVAPQRLRSFRASAPTRTSPLSLCTRRRSPRRKRLPRRSFGRFAATSSPHNKRLHLTARSFRHP